jgi:hypothetical protein
VLALVAWCVEFASHLHVNEVQLSAQGSHFCEMCGAFQAGASASAVPHTFPKLRPAPVLAVASAAIAPLQLTYSYRSRAPPHA